VIALVLSAGSIAAGFLNRAHHPRRFIGFIVLFAVFLIAGIVLLVMSGRRGAGSAPPASR